MDVTMLILRVLHIGFGAFWMGVDVFLTFVLMPRLRILGEDIERPTALAIMRVLPPVMMMSSLVTFFSGIALTGILRGWNFGSLLNNGWGIAILLGFAGTVIALVVGFGLLPPVSIRLEKLARALEGRRPTAAEANQIAGLTAQAESLARINAVLLIFVVISMAVARFV